MVSAYSAQCTQVADIFAQLFARARVKAEIQALLFGGRRGPSFNGHATPEGPSPLTTFFEKSTGMMPDISEQMMAWEARQPQSLELFESYVDPTFVHELDTADTTCEDSYAEAAAAWYAVREQLYMTREVCELIRDNCWVDVLAEMPLGELCDMLQTTL